GERPLEEGSRSWAGAGGTALDRRGDGAAESGQLQSEQRVFARPGSSGAKGEHRTEEAAAGVAGRGGRGDADRVRESVEPAAGSRAGPQEGNEHPRGAGSV